MPVEEPSDERSIALLDLVLQRLSSGASFHEVADEVRWHPARADAFPSAELLELAADALSLGDVSWSTPLPVAEISERWPFKVTGRSHHAKTDYVMRTVAMIQAGMAPDVDDETGWWRLDDLWFHSIAALCAVVAAVASRLGVEPRSVYDQLQR